MLKDVLYILAFLPPSCPVVNEGREQSLSTVIQGYLKQIEELK